MSAHLAAVAAEKQGKFWELHDKLFANQRQLNLDAYKRCAREPKLEVARFEKDLVELENKRKIDEDKAEATAMGITGTPGFFVRQLQLVEDEEGREGAEWLADAQAAMGGRPEVGAVVVPSGKNGFDVCLLSLAHHPERPSMTQVPPNPRPSEQLPELLDRQAGIDDDTAHRKRVDRIVTGNGEDVPSIRHDDVPAFADDLEARLLERPDGLKMGNARELGHYTATSTSRTSAPRVRSATTERYSWIAVRMLSSASSSVDPWDQQPGSPGTDTDIPSSDRTSTTLYRIVTPGSLPIG